MHAGDDLFLVAGSSGDAQYLSHEERGALVAASVSHAKYFLECRLQNPTRVSILNVTFYAGVSYHGRSQRARRDLLDVKTRRRPRSQSVSAKAMGCAPPTRPRIRPKLLRPGRAEILPAAISVVTATDIMQILAAL